LSDSCRRAGGDCYLGWLRPNTQAP
jgi:hypothetical protein